jgi:hypothetical protein
MVLSHYSCWLRQLMWHFGAARRMRRRGLMVIENGRGVWGLVWTLSINGIRDYHEILK